MGFFVVPLLLAALPQLSWADCVPIYGGGDGCSTSVLTITTSVFNPQTNTYVHDMGLTDQRFHPGDTVSFHIIVADNGPAPIGDVSVSDQLPSFLVDANNQTGIIHVETTNLNPGQDRLLTFQAVVVGASHFAAGQIACQNNVALAQADSGPVVQDNAQFCVENIPTTSTTTGTTSTTTTTTTNPVSTTTVVTNPSAPVVYPIVPTTTLPSTGADPLTSLMLLPVGISGIWIKNNTNRFKKRSM